MNRIDSIEVSSDCRLAMAEQARAEFPYECCGILIGRRIAGRVRVDRVVAAENITTGDPRTNYQVDWKTLLDARRELRSEVGSVCGLRSVSVSVSGSGSIVGFYHSHTDGTSEPSRRDVEFAWLGHVYVIIPVGQIEVGEIAAWYARDGDVAFDCLRGIGEVAPLRSRLCFSRVSCRSRTSELR